ncbi:KH domain-containing, RNA-binding, signal transduction-associated protein 2-like, partial [Python bivittatus]|uniref:KH domain-containing, RNA-binding, signal transduction-associated protein 2-like n=1 Tax=Python bivittatus TaxID=176946 RepID=A0A9F2W712_PYTBI
MTSNPQGTPLSAKHLAAALLQNQQQVDVQVTNLQNAMKQLAQQPAQDLPQPTATQQIVAQSMLLCPQGSLPENFGGDQDQFLTFTAQCWNDLALTDQFREGLAEDLRDELFNFVGKLLGPRGNSLKRLQEETGAKMSILGKGSMRDKAKEEELRKSGEAKYAHLSDELHVLIEVFAPPGEAYSRMSHALEEIKKFLVPDYNDEIRQEQLRELSYLNGSEDSPRGRSIRGRGIRVPPAAPSRGRGSAVPPPPPGRGAQVTRGTPVTRGVLPVPPVTRGVPTPRARGVSAVPGYRAPPLPAHEPYEEYGYNDGYGGEYDEPSYEAYDNSYTTQTQ